MYLGKYCDNDQDLQIQSVLQDESVQPIRIDIKYFHETGSGQTHAFDLAVVEDPCQHAPTKDDYERP
jgi:hypothetical protein